jgi:hypothetical protein
MGEERQGKSVDGWERPISEGRAQELAPTMEARDAQVHSTARKTTG